MGIIPETPARGRIRKRSRQEWERLDPAASELLQHELDHLDGVLATDLALPLDPGAGMRAPGDARSLITRAAFAADPAYFQQQVDYVIQPTT